jgi:hypothetical protein
MVKSPPKRIVDGIIENWESWNLGSSLWFLIQSQSHESMSWWIIRKMHQVSCFRMIHHYEYINLHQSMFFFETKKYTQSVSNKSRSVRSVCCCIRSSQIIPCCDGHPAWPWSWEVILVEVVPGSQDFWGPRHRKKGVPSMKKMGKIWRKYGENMANIWWKYGENMSINGLLGGNVWGETLGNIIQLPS